MQENKQGKKHKQEFHRLLHKLYLQVPGLIKEIEIKQKYISLDMQKLIFSQSTTRQIENKIYLRNLDNLKEEYNKLRHEKIEYKRFMLLYEKDYFSGI